MVDRVVTGAALVATVVAGFLVAYQESVLGGLVLAGTGLLIVVLLAVWARRSTAVVLVPLAVVVILTPKTGPEPLVTVAGLSVLPSDVVLAIAGVSALFGLGQVRRQLLGRRWFVGIFTAMIFVQLVVGLMQYGSAAVIDARSYLTLGAIAAYILSLPELPTQAVRRWLYATCLALVLLAAYRGATSGLGTAEVVANAEGVYVTSRVVVANQAALLAAGLVTAWHDWATGRGHRYGVLMLTFGATVVLAQHRSVWVAALVGLLIVTTRVPLQRIVVKVAIGVWLVMLASPLLVYSPASTAVADLLAASSESASLSSGTGGDRVEGARSLIEESTTSGPARLLLGEPFGGGYERIVRDQLVVYQPHNAYVQTFVRTGLVGLFATLGLMLSAWWAAARGRASDPAAVGWLTLFAVFSLAYAFPFELAPLLALGLCSQARSPADADDTKRHPETGAHRTRQLHAART